MWAHRPWVGRFYPRGTKSGTELALSAQWCTAVEGNTTFHAQPTAATVDKEREQTSDNFRFAFKLRRTVTHNKRLLDVGARAGPSLPRGSRLRTACPGTVVDAASPDLNVLNGQRCSDEPGRRSGVVLRRVR